MAKKSGPVRKKKEEEKKEPELDLELEDEELEDEELEDEETEPSFTKAQFMEMLKSGFKDNPDFSEAKALMTAVVMDRVKAKLAGKTPKTSPAKKSAAITSEQFKAMKYGERVQLYNSDRETYNKLSESIKGSVTE